MNKDRSYFLRRAGQEHSAAAGATDEKARAAHAELARRYTSLAEASEADYLAETAA